MVRQILYYANILSIDVALGAVCSALFFAKFSGIEVSEISLLLLALSVWVIYTVDHLSDASKIPGKASSGRHRFHQQHQSVLIRIVGIIIVTIIALLLFLPRPILIGGLMLSSFVMVYLLLNRHMAVTKEIIVAALYSLGVYLPSVQDIQQPHLPILLLLGFFVTALMNLLIFSWYSVDEDLIDGHRSLIIKLGKHNGRFVILLLYALQLFLLIWARFEVPYILLSVMCTLLMIVFCFPGYFKRSERYRIGDVVFFISLTYLFL